MRSRIDWAEDVKQQMQTEDRVRRKYVDYAGETKEVVKIRLKPGKLLFHGKTTTLAEATSLTIFDGSFFSRSWNVSRAFAQHVKKQAEMETKQGWLLAFRVKQNTLLVDLDDAGSAVFMFTEVYNHFQGNAERAWSNLMKDYGAYAKRYYLGERAAWEMLLRAFVRVVGEEEDLSRYAAKAYDAFPEKKPQIALQYAAVRAYKASGGRDSSAVPMVETWFYAHGYISPHFLLMSATLRLFSPGTRSMYNTTELDRFFIPILCTDHYGYSFTGIGQAGLQEMEVMLCSVERTLTPCTMLIGGYADRSTWYVYKKEMGTWRIKEEIPIGGSLDATIKAYCD